MSAIPLIDLVCGVCGSRNWYDDRRSIDERWPIARCRDHKDKVHPYSPLISDRAFQARKKRRADAEPLDVFGSLSPEERERLRQPVRLK